MWWIVVALVLLLVVGQGDPIDGVTQIVDEFVYQRGARLTHATYGTDGVVRADPDQLAALAGVDLNVYAHARCLSSEEGNSPVEIKIAVAWAMWNEANRRGVDMAALMLHARNAMHSGYFGTQKDIDPDSSNRGKSDRYASTALDPYQGDVDICLRVQAGTLPDPTGGAQQFDRPAGESDPAHIAENRIASGAAQVDVPGVDPNVIRFWRT